ncbi:MAG: TolC family protein [Anaerotruncus sp.]|nr:TolC family protein [Anaerotruncus sp.]
MLDSTLRNMQKTYTDMKAMLAQGFIENTDVDQLALTVMNMENALSSITRQLIIAERLLKFQMGIDLDKEISLTDNINFLINESQINKLLSDTFNVKSNINYKLTETQMKLQKLNLKLEKSTYLPTIAAYYNHQEKVNTPDFDFSFPDMIGATINVPIFGSGQKLTRVQQANLELDKSYNTLVMVTDGLILEAMRLKQICRRPNKPIKKKKRPWIFQKKIYNKIYLKYKEGLASSLELTTAHTQYLSSQSNYYTAVLALVNAKNKLKN